LPNADGANAVVVQQNEPLEETRHLRLSSETYGRLRRSRWGTGL